MSSIGDDGACGERLIFEPAISSVYRPRPWADAARPSVLVVWPLESGGHTAPSQIGQCPRHLAAPAFAVGVIVAPIAAFWRPARRPLVLGGVMYVLCLLLATARARSRSVRDVDTPVLIAAFPVMHMSWGLGFLVSLFRRPRLKES